MSIITNSDLLVDGRPVHGTVHVEQEWIDVTPSSEPDPHWLHVDSHGHRHRWMAGPDPVVPLRDPATQNGVLPTLVAVDDTEPHWCSDCLGEYQTWHYECRVCGDVVRPGSRPPIVPHRIPGLKHISIEVTEALALGPVEVTVLTDTPQVMSGWVVNTRRGRTGGGRISDSSRIAVTSAPISKENTR